MNWKNQNSELSAKINSGKKYINGEVLTANELNTVVEEALVSSDFNNVLFGADFINFFKQSANFVWHKNPGRKYNEQSIILNFGSQKIYGVARVEDEVFEELDVSDSSTDSQMIINLKETENMYDRNDGNQYGYAFTISFYLDAGRSKKILDKEIKVTYQAHVNGIRD